MSNPAPRTKPKLLVILGAGSSVELGMPSVGEIDNLMREWARKQAEEAKLPNYFGLLWENRRLYAAHGLESNPTAAEHTAPNYERCLGDMLSLINAVLPHPQAEPLQHSLVSVDFLQSHGLSRETATAEAIQFQFCDLVQRLAERFREECMTLAAKIRDGETPDKIHDGDIPARFQRYCQFLQTLEQHFEIGVYNLNHDTVALTALANREGGGYFLGFEDGRFAPAAVHGRTAWSFLYHLHGSVHQSFPTNGETTPSFQGSSPVFWHTTLTDGPFEVLSQQLLDKHWRDGDGHVLVKTTLVAGGWKLGQLQIDPFQTFYSTLARHAHEADAILIAGYSFGDQHVNAVLKNAFFGRPKTRPPVMVLDYDGRRVVDEDGRAVEDRLIWKRGDGWPFSLVGSLAMGIGAPSLFQPVDSLWVAPEPDSQFPRQAVKQFEAWSGPESVAVWFGGFLAAAERKDEIANWLLRHVPARSEL